MENIYTKFINNINNKQRLIFLYSKNKRKILSCIFILFYVLLFFLIDHSSQSLVAHDEGLYARRSRLVEESSNWFLYPFSIPHHKTIGSYWLIASSIRLFGNSELALRLPSIITSFLCLFITYLIAYKISNKKAALISVFSLSSMPLWLQYSRYASPDIPFVLSILLIILFFLKFKESIKYRNKIIYLFISGLFISIGFFLRSYMVFVPFLGLIPFIVFNLFNEKNIYRLSFLAGVIFGSLPTLLNLYLSYQTYGTKVITSLFEFAKFQAVGEAQFNNIHFIPLNYLYLTFPVGIIFIILLVFTRPNSNIKNKSNNNQFILLTYCYPFLSLAILLSMSTSYPHYYLFLLPSLSILFGIRLNSYSFRFDFSRKIINYSLFFIIFLLSFTMFYLLFNYNQYLLSFSNFKSLLVYIISIALSFTFLSSLRFLTLNTRDSFNLLKFFYNLIIPQYVSLSLLYNFGIIGNPNLKTKLFLNDEAVSSIVKSNTIYLLNVESKIQTLLSYYLPESKVLRPNEDISKLEYIITSEAKFISKFENKSLFKSIRRFDNHILLINISK